MIAERGDSRADRPMAPVGDHGRTTYTARSNLQMVTMNDAERIEALLDLVDPDRSPMSERGPQLAVLGLATLGPKGKTPYRPTAAGWVLMGSRGRAFQPDNY